MRKILFLIGLICLCELLNSCKKEVPVMQPTSNLIRTYKYTSNVTDKVLAKYHDDILNSDFDFFGDFDSATQEVSIKNGVLHRSNKLDTLYNFTFDDNYNVSSLFVTINNKVGNTLFKFNYQDSLTIVSTFNLNVNTKELKLTEKFIVRNLDKKLLGNTKYARLSKTQDKLPSSILKSLTKAILIAGIIYDISLVVCPQCAFATATAYLLYNVWKINDKQAVAEFEKRLGDFWIANAGAAEVDQIPTSVSPNPKIFITELNSANNNNQDWSWCSCAAKITYKVFPGTIATEFNSLNDIANFKKVNATIPLTNPCTTSGELSAGTGSVYFLLRPGKSVTLNVKTAPSWCAPPNTQGEIITFNFTCK